LKLAGTCSHGAFVKHILREFKAGFSTTRRHHKRCDIDMQANENEMKSAHALASYPQKRRVKNTTHQHQTQFERNKQMKE
jgi:uncharacterized protein YdaU (DUF1376 family)